MKLSERSWLVRYIYLGCYLPERTTLCKMFWFGVVKTGAYCAPLVVLYILIHQLIINTKNTLVVFAIALGMLLFVGLLGWLDDLYKNHKNKVKEPSILSEAIYGIKNKVCPIITIERD